MTSRPERSQALAGAAQRHLITQVRKTLKPSDRRRVLVEFIQEHICSYGRTSDRFSIEAMASYCGRHRSTISRWLAQLHQLGIIEYRPSKGSPRLRGPDAFSTISVPVPERARRMARTEESNPSAVSPTALAKTGTVPASVWDSAEGRTYTVVAAPTERPTAFQARTKHRRIETSCDASGITDLTSNPPPYPPHDSDRNDRHEGPHRHQRRAAGVLEELAAALPEAVRSQLRAPGAQRDRLRLELQLARLLRWHDSQDLLRSLMSALPSDITSIFGLLFHRLGHLERLSRGEAEQAVAAVGIRRRRQRQETRRRARESCPNCAGSTWLDTPDEAGCAVRCHCWSGAAA